MKATPENQTLQRRRKTMLILQRNRLWLIYNTDARLTNISDSLKETVITLYKINHISAYNI
jgi:hypothetical protein